MRQVNKNKQKNKVINKGSELGITLIEAIVSIAIISIGLLSAVGLTISNIKASYYSNNKIKAIALAWEGVEVVRNLRDTNWLNDYLYWSEDIFHQSDDTAILVFDHLNGTWFLYFMPDNFEDDQTVVYENNKTGEYAQAVSFPMPIEDWQKTIFKRLIYINKTQEDVLKVKSAVRYKDKFGGYKTVELQEDLYNWK